MSLMAFSKMIFGCVKSGGAAFYTPKKPHFECWKISRISTLEKPCNEPVKSLTKMVNADKLYNREMAQSSLWKS